MKDKASNFENVHWADFSAQRVIDTFPNQKLYTIASGITPSGIVHIGNFREVITSELVRRALEKKGKKTKFIYSWDIYDAFRKVPKNIPDEWSKYLRMGNSKVPDPWECHESYAVHFMTPMEEDVRTLGFPIEFQYQDKLFESGIYADEIKFLFENKDKVIKILNNHKDKNLLDSSWCPAYVYCSKCHKDTTKILNYLGGYELEYMCECSNREKINFKETPIVGLFWRVDWPMRWKFYEVDFEPGGKDHSTPSGSYDTAKEIVKELYGREPPVYTQYNFIGMKGGAGKISSSSGNGVSVRDVLEVYTPELLMFLFVGTKPNSEFNISFDLDVIKIYEDFDKIERIYYSIEEEKNPKQLANKKRIYELSMPGGVEIQKNIPFQLSIRHLTTVAQANDFDFKKVNEYYSNDLKTDFDKNRLKERFDCVKNWLEKYAPDEMKFSIQEKIKVDLNSEEKKILTELKNKLVKVEVETDLIPFFKELCEEHGIEVKDFFKLVYTVVVGKERGPKLSGLLFENKNKIIDLLGKL